MIEKRVPLEDEEPRHRKKSKKRGQPRADHKHEYKTVLLLNEYESQCFSGKTTLYERPTKICTICGRIGGTDMSLYDLVEVQDSLPVKVYERVIKDKELLEKWYVDDYFDKFAKKVEEA